MAKKKHDCKKCIHHMTYRDTMAYYESDNQLCTKSSKIACWEITKCSHYKEKETK